MRLELTTGDQESHTLPTEPARCPIGGNILRFNVGILLFHVGLSLLGNSEETIKVMERQ